MYACSGEDAEFLGYNKLNQTCQDLMKDCKCNLEQYNRTNLSYFLFETFKKNRRIGKCT